MTKTENIIEELQLEAANENQSVTGLLRKAKIIATKLELKDFLIWINSELKGYTTEDCNQIPEYRQTTGEPKAYNPYRGWETIISKDAEYSKLASTVYLNQPIGSLEDLIKRYNDNGNEGRLEVPYSPEKKQALMKGLEMPTDIKLFVSISTAVLVVDAVRDTLLDWSLKLASVGITGEGLSFTKQEIKEAKPTTQVFYAQNIGNIGDMHDQASIQPQTAELNIDLKHLHNTIQDIENHVSSLPETIRPKALNEIATIKEELNDKSPDRGKLSEHLRSLRTVCEGAAGSVVGQGIISLIKDIL